MYKIILIYIMLVSISLAQETATGHKQCTTCHPQHGAVDLLQPLPALCITCHKERVEEGEHIINIAPKTAPPAELSLLNNVISCTTCHDPHATKPGQLRLSKNQLCQACHRL